MQLTTDGHKMYIGAVEDAFGVDVDYAMLTKAYGKPSENDTRCSPAKILSSGSKGQSDSEAHQHVVRRACA